MEIDDYLGTIQESLGYSIMHIENFDYRGKYNMTTEEAYKQKLATLKPLQEAKAAVSKRIKELKTKKP